MTTKVFLGYKGTIGAGFVPDEDLCGQNIALLQSTVLRELLKLPLQSNVKEGHDVGYVDDEGMTFNPDRLLSTAYVHTNYVGRPT